MSLLEIKNLSFSYGEEQLYNQANMRFFKDEHAVLVGPNGTGKSTLLKLLDHRLKPDQGVVEWVSHIKVGYLDQYAHIDPTIKVKDYLYEVYKQLFDKEERLNHLYKAMTNASSNLDDLMQKASRIQEELLESDFYTIKSQVLKILSGLGLDETILDNPIKTLSGGMRAKIILSKLLLEEADVLLLDEPTNFLDVRHIEWLTKFLQNYPKAFLVVSHHEEFLKAIATTVFALELGEITRYKGNYDFYQKEKALRMIQQEKSFVSQQKFIQKTESFIQKNITRAKTSKRAKSRRKMLEKLPRIKAPVKDKTYQFYFPLGKSTGKEVLKVHELEIGYEFPLVDPISFTILKEDKVAITGKNGIGKSTLIKTLLNQIEALGGKYQWIDTAIIAYFKQDESYQEGLTPFSIIHHVYPNFTKQDIMSLLGSHGVHYDMAHREMSTLSGGEQTKVRLALLRHKKANVLILDEPTNHLDFAAKEALKDALIDYQGTLILVSHEQDFYQDICDYEITLYES
ncbi:MAG: ABC-F family ATP-binding cassette domain-containing protein [Candidatus Izemoplasmataceae bacterium]